MVGRENRSQSRRVVFRIRVKSLEQRGLERRLGVMTQSPAENQDLVVQVLCEKFRP